MEQASVVLFGVEAVHVAWYWFGPHLHGVPWVVELAAQLLRFCGAPATAVGEYVVIPSDLHVFRLCPSLDNLGALPAVAFMAGLASGLAAMRCLTIRALVQLGLLLTGFCVWRFLLLCGLLLGGVPGGITWEPGATAVSLLLFGCAAHWVLARSAQPHAQTVLNGCNGASLDSGKGLVDVVWRGCVLAGSILAACGAVCADSGSPKDGAILIDEGHSDWERSDVPMNRDVFGQESTYNYGTLARQLQQYYNVTWTRAPITYPSLSGTAVLVVKTPTRPFSVDEVGCIQNFVANGGGLFLIGDHTNVFGTSACLNDLARPFGIEYQWTATYDLATGGLSYYKPPRLAPHPIVAGMRGFLFATSCTLSAQWPARAVIRGYGLQILPSDWSHPSFFSTSEDYQVAPQWGVFNQCATRAWGKGRVVAFSDSTVWSNFFTCIPGRLELMLGSTEWLMRCNRWEWALRLAELVGWALALVGVVGALWRRHDIGAVWAMGYAGVVVALWMGTLWNAHMTRMPQEKRSMRKVAFIMEGDVAFLPVLRLTSTDPAVPEYLNLFNSVQRVGALPVVARSVNEAVEGARVVVLVRPKSALIEDACSGGLDFVRAGGRLVVIGDARRASDLGPLIRLCGGDLRLREEPEKMDPEGVAVSSESELFSTEAGSEMTASQDLWTRLGYRLEGGKAILKDGQHEALITQYAVGHGLVVVCGADVALSDAWLRDNEALLPDRQRELYDVVYGIWDVVLQDIPEWADSRTGR